jgi:uncharacterized protein (TIGR03437 family)
MKRIFAALAVWSCTAYAQFTGLGTSYDGSAVYFASDLRIKGSNEPTHGKLFVADEAGVRLFRSRDETPVPPSVPSCGAGSMFAYLGAEVSADGRTIAAAMQGNVQTMFCEHGTLYLGTDLISPAGDHDFPLTVRLSPAGHYALAWGRASAIDLSPISIFFLDLQTGLQIPVSLPSASPYDGFGPPSSGGRVIANDGTAIFQHVGSDSAGGLIARPSADPQPFPVQDGNPLAIDANATHVPYDKVGLSQLRAFNLKTGEDRLTASYKGPLGNVAMSDDGQQILFVDNGQVYTVGGDGSGLRQLTNDPAGIVAAALSGDGKIAYATTGGARLIKVHIDTGVEVEIIGRTPYLTRVERGSDAGMAFTISGGGLSDTSLQASPPLDPWLGNLTMWIGDRKVPVLAVSPINVSFLVPWDIVPWFQGIAPAPQALAETPGIHSPFDFPVAPLRVSTFPRAGAIAHQNWDGLVDCCAGAPHAGEIIHVWAVGLGAVVPEVVPGTIAPSAEPLARLASPMVCDNSQILYAGLAPGYLERVYQVDLKIGNVTGYTKFNCSIGSLNFLFLSLNVLP